MGTNQHLIRSICAIRKQGGVKISDDEFIMPDPILVGRNMGKLQALATAQGIERVTTETSTPRWPTRTTSSISTPRPPVAAPTR